MTALILASGSASRARMLEAAGVAFAVQPSQLDEDILKKEAELKGWSAVHLAEELASAKAVDVAQAEPDAFILGCDQVLECSDGSRIDKARSLDELAGQLARLSGDHHWLHAAAVIVHKGQSIWSATQSAKMTMRALSKAFIADYLAQEGESLLGCVGGYKIEGRGAQLFSNIDGNNFVVQGLPLLPLLAFLRSKAVLNS